MIVKLKLPNPILEKANMKIVKLKELLHDHVHSSGYIYIKTMKLYTIFLDK